jgi:hypothetical protein
MQKKKPVQDGESMEVKEKRRKAMMNPQRPAVLKRVAKEQARVEQVKKENREYYQKESSWKMPRDTGRRVR